MVSNENQSLHFWMNSVQFQMLPSCKPPLALLPSKQRFEIIGKTWNKNLMTRIIYHHSIPSISSSILIQDKVTLFQKSKPRIYQNNLQEIGFYAPINKPLILLYSYFILFYFILFYFILFHSILFYFILFHFILFYFIYFSLSYFIYFILFYFILFYFILFYFILFYFILLYLILFYFILFHLILFYFILFHFTLFYFILFYFIIFYFILFYSILFCTITFYSILGLFCTIFLRSTSIHTMILGLSLRPKAIHPSVFPLISILKCESFVWMNRTTILHFNIVQPGGHLKQPLVLPHIWNYIKTNRHYECDKKFKKNTNVFTI